MGNILLHDLDLESCVNNEAALRCRQRLQPVGGIGDKVFPPTYPGRTKGESQHVFERRNVGGEQVWTVLLDSVQSQANRSEEALLREVLEGTIEVPMLRLDFSKSEVPEIPAVTSLEAPHRIFDAVFRDSELDGKPFGKSDTGRNLAAATMANASEIFEKSPSALLYGVWNSTGESGGLGAKFPRVYVSEIVGFHVPVHEHEKSDDPTTAGRRTGSRVDPLGIRKGVEIFKSSTNWDTTALTKDYKKSKPSEINHGNIAPTVSEAGVTMAHAEQTFVLSFAGLRRLQFGSRERNVAARNVLVALGLLAHLAQTKNGYELRSRCSLVPENVEPIELVRSNGTTRTVHISYDDAVALYAETVSAAREAGFDYSAAPTELVPQKKLVDIIVRSRQIALAGSDEAEGELGKG